MKTPIKLSAPDYINALFDWVEAQVFYKPSSIPVEAQCEECRGTQLSQLQWHLRVDEGVLKLCIWIRGQLPEALMGFSEYCTDAS